MRIHLESFTLRTLPIIPFNVSFSVYFYKLQKEDFMFKKAVQGVNDHTKQVTAVAKKPGHPS